MDSPGHHGSAGSTSLNSAGLPRSPFMPVRRGAKDSNNSAGAATPRPNSGHSIINNKGSMTPTAISKLTANNLSSLEAVNNNQQSHSVEMDAGSSSMGSSSLGIGRPLATATARTAGHTMLNSTKRYTRQMAPTPASPEDGIHASTTTISANDLKVKARVTSGSAPRRKIGVPGAERADPAVHSWPETPSLPSSSVHRRQRSNSRPPVPSIPSRPPSRAGGDMFSHPSASVSRPQSRMDDYGPECIISAGGASSVLETPMRRLSMHHSMRRDSSDSSLATVHSKQENVLVCVRVRPPAGPSPLALEEAWDADSERKAIRLLQGGNGADYRFDAVVTGSGNEQVYAEAAKPLIMSSMSGYDAVIFAYGQTASGKTFTLSGTPSNPGIIPQAVQDIFSYIRSHPNKEFLLRASYIEIYNEQLRDLLTLSNDPNAAQQIKVRQDENKKFFVSPLREEVVTNEAGVKALLERGEKNRHTAGTDYNARSSRSHTVFQLVIESRDVNNGLSSLRQPPKRPTTPGLSRTRQEDDGRSVVTSRLSLIDLAGSEKATSQADRRVEGAFINKSLLTLEKVIAALTEDKARAHVPYRDSKLTQILQPSLSGEARVAVICTINPSCIAVQESTSTLKFAQRVKKVTLHAERNEVVGDKALLIRYEQTIAEMTAYIAQLEQSHPSVPATPRQSDGDDDGTFPPARKDNVEVAKAKEDRAKLLGYIVNAGNIDDKRNDAPRPVSPVKPVKSAELPLIQEQLLDAQDKVGELEEANERQRDEIAALKAQLAAASQNGHQGADEAMEALRQRNAELEKTCNEFRTILQNEDRTTALKSERRLAAREWSEKLQHMQKDLDKTHSIRDQLIHDLNEERKKNAQLERTLLKRAGASGGQSMQAGFMFAQGEGKENARPRRRSGSLDGLALLSSESPMIDIRGSYLNLDELADSPIATPLRSRLR